MSDSKLNSGDMPEQPHSLIVRVVSSVLDKLICGHVDSPRRGLCSENGFLKFQSSYAPDVTIEAYLERIRRYSRCSDACFVMSLVYVDRLIESKQLVLTSLNAHRLLITSVMLAAKFHDDLFYNNAYYSKLGGLSLNELNHLESELLQLLDFSLFVHETAYCKYSKQLQNYILYLDVYPALAAPPCEAVSYAGCVDVHAPTVQYNTVSPCPPLQIHRAPLSVVHPSVLQAAYAVVPMDLQALGCHHGGVYGDYDYSTSGPTSLMAVNGHGAPRIPSPDNPHAKACSYSEQYIAANSPLRIAPTSAAHGYQQQAQAMSHALQQQIAYGTRETADYGAASGGGMSAAMGGYLQSYVSSSLRDSADDSTTTTCSTRTSSPYPALYTRSNSASATNLNAGTSAVAAKASADWTSSCDSLKKSNSPSQQGYHKRSQGLCIQTDSATLGLDSAYPLQRNDSNRSVGSISTACPSYSAPQYQYAPQAQAQQGYQQAHAYEHQLNAYHQQLLQYQQATAAQPSPMGLYAQASLSQRYQHPQHQQGASYASQGQGVYRCDSGAGLASNGGWQEHTYVEPPMVVTPTSSFPVPPLPLHVHQQAQAHAQAALLEQQQQQKLGMWRYAQSHASSASHHLGMSDYPYGRPSSAYCNTDVM